MSKVLKVDDTRLADERIRISFDDYPENPREHFGSPFVYVSESGWGGDRDKKIGKGWASFPVYCYEHSGRTVSIRPTVPFGGTCGRIGIDPARLWEIGIDPAEYRKDPAQYEGRIREAAGWDIRLVDDWMNGSVYGFVRERWSGEQRCWEHLDSCWGFFGTDLEYILEGSGKDVPVCDETGMFVGKEY